MPSTVILGGGIIGLSTAYYLAKLARDGDGNGDAGSAPHTIHLVEACPELFASASGKAGGFIAQDWFNPAMAPLGRLSFDLHRALAAEHGGPARWGWSESISYSLDRSAGAATTDSDSASNSDATASDLDSDAPVSPASGRESPRATGEGMGAGVAAEGGRGLSGERGAGVATATATEVSAGGVSSSADWVDGMSRVPIVEQRTADALAALADAQGAEDRGAAARAQAEAEAEKAAAAAVARLEEPYWLQVPSPAMQVISDRTTTAQINPHQLCEFLLEECIAMGVRLHHPARAAKLVHSDPDNPASQAIIRVDGLAATSTGREFLTGTVDLPCDNLVITAGCWTPEVFHTLFPTARRTPTVQGYAGYSVVVRSRHWQPLTSQPVSPAGPLACHAVFTSDPTGFSPELYSRAGGELWIGGVNSATLPLPPRAMDAKPDKEGIDRILAVTKELCGEDVEVLQASLCFRPITPSGKPLIVRVPDAELGQGVIPRSKNGKGAGVFLGVGHGPWGISLSLGTGLVLSEMILGRPTSADVSPLARW